MHIGRTIEPSGRPLAERLGRMGISLVILGLALHLVAIVLRGVATHRAPWGNMYEYVSVIGFVTLAVWVVMMAKFPIRRATGFVLVPIVILLFLGGTVLYTQAEPVEPALQSYWLAVHVTIVSVATGVLIIPGVASILYLLRSAHERKPAFLPKFAPKLPSADTLDRLAYRTTVIGLPLFTLGVICGAIWADSAWGHYWQWDPKETTAFVAWVVYAAYLHSRATAGWRGTRGGRHQRARLRGDDVQPVLHQPGRHRPALLRGRRLSRRIRITTWDVPAGPGRPWCPRRLPSSTGWSAIFFARRTPAVTGRYEEQPPGFGAGWQTPGAQAPESGGGVHQAPGPERYNDRRPAGRERGAALRAGLQHAAGGHHQPGHAARARPALGFLPGAGRVNAHHLRRAGRLGRVPGPALGRAPRAGQPVRALPGPARQPVGSFPVQQGSQSGPYPVQGSQSGPYAVPGPTSKGAPYPQSNSQGTPYPQQGGYPQQQGNHAFPFEQQYPAGGPTQPPAPMPAGPVPPGAPPGNLSRQTLAAAHELSSSHLLKQAKRPPQTRLAARGLQGQRRTWSTWARARPTCAGAS